MLVHVLCHCFDVYAKLSIDVLYYITQAALNIGPGGILLYKIVWQRYFPPVIL